MNVSRGQISSTVFFFYRRMGTEYRSNYKSPTRYGYDRGAWKGASAPQMMPRAVVSEKLDRTLYCFIFSNIPLHDLLV